MRGLDIGPCLERWKSLEYLVEKGGDKPTKVHVSKSPQMDFINKNFMYRYKKIILEIKPFYWTTLTNKMNEWMNGWMADGQMIGQINELTDEWMNGWMNEGKEAERKDGQMNEWIDGKMDE